MQERRYDQKTAEAGKWYWDLETIKGSQVIVKASIFKAEKRAKGELPKKGSPEYFVKSSIDNAKHAFGTADRICVQLDQGEEPIEVFTNITG
jgi:hypothetical protein